MQKSPKINFPNKVVVEEVNLLSPEKGKGYFGLSYKDEAIIKIDPCQTPKEYFDTLIHECLHILFKQWKEQDIYNLAVFISQFLWDNGYRKVYLNTEISPAFGVTPKGQKSEFKKIRKMKIPPPIKSNDYITIKPEYENMFSSALITRQDETSRAVDKIIKNREKYEKVGIAPWYWIGCIHHREASFNFKTHLHNGDPLKRRTVNVPSGRPKSEPTLIDGYAWDISAKDALLLKKLDKWLDWSIPGMLFQAERYNGWGYRMYNNNNSPYIWSGTQFWVSGKYVSDGKYDPNASRDQIGVAALLKEMLNRKIFS